MDFTTVQKNLEERGFAVSTFATAKEAADYLNAQIDRSSVSFGGSMTLSQMGLFESLGAHNTMYSHWNVPDGMNAEEVLRNASTCENYLLSANGLAETGRDHQHRRHGKPRVLVALRPQEGVVRCRQKQARTDL